MRHTRFSFGKPRVTSISEHGGTLSTTLTNLGTRAGRHVVQVYGRRRSGAHQRESWLLGFAAVAVEAESQVSVTVDFSRLPLALWSREQGTRVLPDLDDVILKVGADARAPDALVVELP